MIATAVTTITMIWVVVLQEGLLHQLLLRGRNPRASSSGDSFWVAVVALTTMKRKKMMRIGYLLMRPEGRQELHEAVVAPALAVAVAEEGEVEVLVAEEDGSSRRIQQLQRNTNFESLNWPCLSGLPPYKEALIPNKEMFNAQCNSSSRAEWFDGRQTIS
jgi:hypothetical protein